MEELELNEQQLVRRAKLLELADEVPGRGVVGLELQDPATDRQRLGSSPSRR